MIPLTPREAVRARLMAAVQGVKPSDLIPGTAGKGGELPATYRNAMETAMETERIALMLLAVIGHEGGDPLQALQVVFVALDQGDPTPGGCGV